MDEGEELTIEPAVVHLRDGRTGPAEVRVHRRSRGAQVGMGLASVLGGLLLALVFLPIPGLHFFSTWACPLFGLILGYWLFTGPGSVEAASATCPACSERVDLPGGTIETDMWRACPRCAVPMNLEVR